MWLAVIGLVILVACCIARGRSVSPDEYDMYEDVRTFYENERK